MKQRFANHFAHEPAGTKLLSHRNLAGCSKKHPQKTGETECQPPHQSVIWSSRFHQHPIVLCNTMATKSALWAALLADTASNQHCSNEIEPHRESDPAGIMLSELNLTEVIGSEQNTLSCLTPGFHV